jgi:asparagine synthase (glutamine-hydrolysing)
MPSPDSPPSVLGDFVFAWGPGALDWLKSLDGMTLLSEPNEPAQVAVRGAARAGRSADGARWVALADLIGGGNVDEGTRALAPGAPPQVGWRGRFAQVVWHPGERKLAALSDHFSTLSLYTLHADGAVAVATDFRLLAKSPWCKREIDLSSVYHYLNFAQVPAPGTLYRGIRRVEPGTRFSFHDGRVAEDRYWVPEYPDDVDGPEESLARELEERMIATVHAYRPDGEFPWGCFLSGGTDSSSITTILARKGRVRSFSIGFAEQGYDELGFAKIAAEACGADPTFHSVSREEAQSLVTRVVDAYDQPMGNASAVPTLACGRLAQEKGVQLLLAGDGGDEIFGGNERYAKDQIMEAWFAMPSPLKAAGRVMGSVVAKSGNFFLNRVDNFFHRASLPNPDRFYSDDSFSSDHYETLLTPEFRREVSRDASLDWMRGVYRLGRTGGGLHRVMRLDLMNAIAQNDLRKVDGATRPNGVSVRFPYLDPVLVNWVNRLPERYKVRGLTKRYLFKKATRNILPEAILKKKKQGFGLPIAVWMRSDRAFVGMVRETIFSSRARARGWFQSAFVEQLFAEHERGEWDHSDYLWRILMLELWLRRYVDAA